MLRPTTASPRPTCAVRAAGPSAPLARHSQMPSAAPASVMASAVSCARAAPRSDRARFSICRMLRPAFAVPSASAQRARRLFHS